MRAWGVVLIAAAGCGRLGFGDADAGGSDAPAGDAPGSADGAIPKPDAAPEADADTRFDAALGTGGYTVARTGAPYVYLAGAPVPGFAMGDDDNNYTLPLPFTFAYYGIAYTSVTVSLNGYVTFGAAATGATTYDNDCPLDATAPDATIAVFWDDLFASAINAPMGSLSYATSGTPPAQQLAIEWRDMDAYYRTGNGGNYFTQGVRVTQTLVLHENGVIELHYGPRTPPTSPNQDCGPERHQGCSATIGLEAPGTTTTTPIQCGTAAGPGPGYIPIVDGDLITFTPS